MPSTKNAVFKSAPTAHPRVLTTKDLQTEFGWSIAKIYSLEHDGKLRKIKRGNNTSWSYAEALIIYRKELSDSGIDPDTGLPTGNPPTAEYLSMIDASNSRARVAIDARQQKRLLNKRKSARAPSRRQTARA